MTVRNICARPFIREEKSRECWRDTDKHRQTETQAETHTHTQQCVSADDCFSLNEEARTCDEVVEGMSVPSQEDECISELTSPGFGINKFNPINCCMSCTIVRPGECGLFLPHMHAC